MLRLVVLWLVVLGTPSALSASAVRGSTMLDAVRQIACYTFLIPAKKLPPNALISLDEPLDSFDLGLAKMSLKPFPHEVGSFQVFSNEGHPIWTSLIEGQAAQVDFSSVYTSLVHSMNFEGLTDKIVRVLIKHNHPLPPIIGVLNWIYSPADITFVTEFKKWIDAVTGRSILVEFELLLAKTPENIVKRRLILP